MASTASFDLVVLGSGFAGSLMAMVGRQLGLSVLLVERSCHPRFAIGESSTPLTNLLLEELAQEFSLDFLRDFSKWGSWQREHPSVACGLKRGFSFFHHREGVPFTRRLNHANELLVAASPSDSLADTHWYRPDFDMFMVQRAISFGVVYWDQTALREASERDSFVDLVLDRTEGVTTVRAEFVVDATGPRGAFYRAFKLADRTPVWFPPTRALFAHFEGLPSCGEQAAFQLPQDAPYAIDDAAVHHVFPAGWFWTLRFNNGIASAGVVARADWEGAADFDQGAEAWRQVVSKFPGLSHLLASDSGDVEFRSLSQVSFLCEPLHSRRWALLPSAAAFVDPLFSTGFPLALLGIIRMGRAFRGHWHRDSLYELIQRFGRQTFDEVDRVGKLVGLAYRFMDCPAAFNAVSYLYFAAVSFEEMRRRLRQVPSDNGFLLLGDARYGGRFDACLEELAAMDWSGSSEEAERICNTVQEAIEPFNVMGLGRSCVSNWYPVDLPTLFAAKEKLGVDAVALREMLIRAGVAPGAVSHLA